MFCRSFHKIEREEGEKVGLTKRASHPVSGITFQKLFLSTKCVSVIARWVLHRGDWLNGKTI